MPGCLIEAGDIEKSNGMGGQSIYGPSLSSALRLHARLSARNISV